MEELAWQVLNTNASRETEANNYNKVYMLHYNINTNKQRLFYQWPRRCFSFAGKISYPLANSGWANRIVISPNQIFDHGPPAGAGNKAN